MPRLHSLALRISMLALLAFANTGSDMRIGRRAAGAGVAIGSASGIGDRDVDPNAAPMRASLDRVATR